MSAVLLYALSTLSKPRRFRPARGVPIRGNEVGDTVHKPARGPDRRARL
jgi:hypothetical protein